MIAFQITQMLLIEYYPVSNFRTASVKSPLTLVQQYTGGGSAIIYARPTESSKKLNEVLQQRKALRHKAEDNKGDKTPAEPEQGYTKDGYAPLVSSS